MWSRHTGRFFSQQLEHYSSSSAHGSVLISYLKKYTVTVIKVQVPYYSTNTKGTRAGKGD